MSPALPGQRSAQTPARAAVAASRAVGRAVSAGGGLSSQMIVRLTNADPYVLTVDENGQEVRKCRVTGSLTPEGRPQLPAEGV